MVLDSQIRRAGGGRRHMASRRRRSRRWPWVVIVIGGLGLLGWLAWPSGEGGEPGVSDDRFAQASETADTASEAATAPETSAGSGGANGQAADAPDAGDRADRRQREQQQPSESEPSAPEPSAPPAFTLGNPGAAEPAPAADPPEPDRSPTPAQGQPSRELSSQGEGAAAQASSDTEPAPTTRDPQQAVRDVAGDDRAEVTNPVDRARRAARGAGGEFQRGMDLIAEGEFVEGRRVLSRLLYSDRLSSSDARTIRDTLTSVNRELIFSSNVVPGDPITDRYTVQPGDLIASIARQFKVPYQFVMQINGIRDARSLQAGQNIKLIKGPFDARVDKSGFRMDITVEGPDGEPLYVCSFPVGLGENDSTPPGEWIVTPGRKVVNPSWRNPRTGEFFSADDPENPIGNYWIALEGADAQTRDLTGYGIHGTIEPETVGQQRSMGCIRLLDDDIEQVFFMLQEGESRVTVVP